MQKESKYIYRKEICDLLECSAVCLRNNEKRWRLDAARCDLHRKEARYFRSRVIKTLLELGLIEAENNTK